MRVTNAIYMHVSPTKDRVKQMNRAGIKFSKTKN